MKLPFDDLNLLCVKKLCYFFMKQFLYLYFSLRLKHEEEKGGVQLTFGESYILFTSKVDTSLCFLC